MTNSRKLFIFFILVLLVTCFTPDTSLAAPAGNSADLSGSPGRDITFDTVLNIIRGFSCYVAQVAGILFIGAILFYGVLMVVSQGNPEKFGAAKKGLGWAIVGGLVIVGVYVIISTVASAVGDSAYQDYQSVAPINCSAYF